MVPPFWKPEVRNQGVGRIGSLMRTVWGNSRPLLWLLVVRGTTVGIPWLVIHYYNPLPSCGIIPVTCHITFPVYMFLSVSCVFSPFIGVHQLDWIGTYSSDFILTLLPL